MKERNPAENGGFYSHCYTNNHLIKHVHFPRYAIHAIATT